MPSLPSTGENVLRWAVGIHAVVRSILPFSGPGVRVNRQAIGTTYTGDGESSASPETSQPFDLTIGVHDGERVATFVPGAGQNLVPDNVLETVSVPGGETSYAFLRLNTDGKSVQNCTLMVTTTAPASPVPVKNALPAQVDVLLHLIAYTAGSGANPGTYQGYRVFWPATSVWLKSVEAFRTSRDNSGDSGLPYDPWYTWEPTNVDH